MVKTTLKDKNAPKQFSLSPAQANLILFIQQHQQAIIAATLSNIAYSVGYNVTNHTQFELSDDYKVLKVCEIAPKAPETPVVQAK
jgi:hypothetical protein